MKKKGIPTLDLEKAIAEKRGEATIAGIDEVGRGAFAGPVVAAAVILPLDDPTRIAALKDVTDSKLLTFRKRESLDALIRSIALSYGIGSCSAEFIDENGIIIATQQAMFLAVEQLAIPPNHLLIDGRNLQLRQLNIPQQLIIRGDQLSLSIAAASILAKVWRDNWMITCAKQYPAYDFAHNKGYGTASHLHALQLHGTTPIHRQTFKPMKERLPLPEQSSYSAEHCENKEQIAPDNYINITNQL